MIRQLVATILDIDKATCSMSLDSFISRELQWRIFKNNFIHHLTHMPAESSMNYNYSITRI